MQIEQIHGGKAGFRAAMYPQQDHRTIQFLQTQVEQAVQNSAMLNSAAQQFYQQVQQQFDSHFSEEAMRLAKAATMKDQLLFDKDDIRPLVTLHHIQNARAKMQRFIMANPDIRKAYHLQRCDGFSGSYIDPQPKAIGVNQYDYRLVTNGVMMEDSDGDFSISFHYEDLHELDQPLDNIDKNHILNTWDYAVSLLKQGEDDPTSTIAGKL